MKQDLLEKMPSVFTNDIIYEILKLLKDTEIYENSLYDCLYVNRDWCRLTVPFLWRTTFQKETKSNTLITTYISCLKERCHHLLSNDEQYMLNSVSFLTLPLFEYEMYLREFSFKSLNKAVKNWVDKVHEIEDQRKDNLVRKLETSLYKMFAERSILESIAIEFEIENCWNIFESLKFSTIKNLSLSFPSMKDGYFLSKVKRFIRTLKLRLQSLNEVCFFVDEASKTNDLICRCSEEIISFVKAQKNLEGFNLIGREDDFLYATEIISSSLKSHSHSLIHLNIDNVRFKGTSFDDFEKCHNLESLGMGYCTGLDLSNMDIKSNFTNLKKLELSLNQFSPEITVLILKKAGYSLIELEIDDLPPEIIEALETYCNKIENLSISGRTNFSLPWLSRLKNLKRLEFMRTAESYYELDAEEIDQLSPNYKIKKILTELFSITDFDSFYQNTHHLDFSLVKITFSPEVKNFKSVRYEDPQSCLEIDISSSSGHPSDEMDYKHITLMLRKKRSESTLLNFHYLIGKLQEREFQYIRNS